MMIFSHNRDLRLYLGQKPMETAYADNKWQIHNEREACMLTLTIPWAFL